MLLFLTQDMPIVVIFKAMAVENEQEILQMIGSEDMIMTAMTPSFEECHQLQVFTKLQVCVHTYIYRSHMTYVLVFNLQLITIIYSLIM